MWCESLQCTYISLKMTKNVAGKINHIKIEICSVIKVGGKKVGSRKQIVVRVILYMIADHVVYL
jgi:hypothetical protein